MARCLGETLSEVRILAVGLIWIIIHNINNSEIKQNQREHLIQTIKVKQKFKQNYTVQTITLFHNHQNANFSGNWVCFKTSLRFLSETEYLTCWPKAT
jgi:hypothetical protein